MQGRAAASCDCEPTWNKMMNPLPPSLEAAIASTTRRQICGAVSPFHPSESTLHRTLVPNRLAPTSRRTPLSWSP